MSALKPLANKGIWIFGYGSLIWRADFPFARRAPAFIDGWSRRFWQGSSDHRGVPGAPGRVVTLVSEPGARCWGMAYEVRNVDADEVLSHLDHREKGGYDRLDIILHLHGREPVSGLAYHAAEGNPDFLGEAPLPKIARQVIRSTGPSGSNSDYVLQLDKALRELNAGDTHVEELARLVQDPGNP